MKRIIDDNIKNKIVNIILKEVSLKASAIYVFRSSENKYEKLDNNMKIAIISSSEISLKDKYYLKERLSQNLRISIELIILPEDNSNLMMKILHKGYLLYEKDDYNVVLDNMYEELEFDFHFMQSYMEENDKFI